MHVIIAGSRGITDLLTIYKAVEDSGFKITTVISGTARGVDKLGEHWARDNNKPVQQYPANWEVFGKSAGYRRNEVMASHADALIAVWDGVSKGTAHMINIMKAQHKPVHIYYV